MSCKKVKKSLETTFEASKTNETELDLLKSKFIIFSDLHRGQGDGADDFKKCKPAYHAALEYYHYLGYTLILLGDVEELWECFPKKVLRTYKDTFELEKRFADDNRYIRIWGNHDDLWRYKGKVNKLLGKYIGNNEVYEGRRFRVDIGGEEVILFFTHGHQGSLLSDSWSRVGRFLVRIFWRNIQRITHIRSTTSAKDFELRKKSEKAMYDWAAERKEKVILIDGHTHHPVFSSKFHEDEVEDEIAKKEKELETEADEEEKENLRKEIAYKKARLGWVKAKSKGIELKFPGELKPCFFNTGCCSFSDGDVTGIEIADGWIHLVRCPDEEGKKKPEPIKSRELKKLVINC